LEPRTAVAFAPGVISNFFTIHTESLAGASPDFSRAGATGGGFTLSKGVYTQAWIVRSASRAISVAVNGDASYPADTTRKAVELLLEGVGGPPYIIELVQRVDVPIRAGFGSSSASALSAVMAVASALDLGWSIERVASFAHQAEIVRHTGLGTVSSTYAHSGAGLVVHPGGPGVARVVKVRVPRGCRVVTAALLPPPSGRGGEEMKEKTGRDRRAVLASTRMRNKVNMLGELALHRASDYRLDSLLAAGQEFAEKLGLMTRAIKTLVGVALSEGALGASQNMIGDAMHAVVPAEEVERVIFALRTTSRNALISTFRIGGRRAKVLKERWENP
jgi:pantoate kinase